MYILSLLLEEAEPKNNWGSLIIMGVLIVAIIGLFVWQTISGKKKQKEAQNMVNTLKIGDRVKTIGGICGFVAQINDAENTFVLETGLEENKSYIKFDKGAIYQTAPAQGNSVEAPKKSEEKKEEVKAEAKAQPEATENTAKDAQAPAEQELAKKAAKPTKKKAEEEK